MGAFDSKPLNTTPLNNKLRRNPLLFGVPFVVIMVVASYALVPFAQTKYELQDRKISKVRPQSQSSSTKNPEFYAESLGLERAGTRLGESEEKVRHPRGILCKCLLQSFAPIAPIYLPSALETQREDCRGLGAQTHRTSSWNP